jgi:hypothetical protein
MSPLAFYRDLISKGVPEAAAYEIASKFEADREAEVRALYEGLMDRLASADPAAPSVDKRQARNARYYQNKRLKASENKTDKTVSDVSDASKTVSDTALTCVREVGLTSSLRSEDKPPVSPDGETPPPKLKLAKPNGFARFWDAYPNKVGKRAAEAEYERALKRISGPDPPKIILAGLERAKRSRQWAEGFIPHPKTWLHQDRWEDQPTEVQPNPRQANGPHHNQRQPTARDDRLSRMLAGAMASADERPGGMGGGSDAPCALPPPRSVGGGRAA